MRLGIDIDNVISNFNEELLKEHYKRYLENKLREAFGFMGTNIRISVRTRSDKKSR